MPQGALQPNERRLIPERNSFMILMALVIYMLYFIIKKIQLCLDHTPTPCE